jgi:hypothetical protein
MRKEKELIVKEKRPVGHPPLEMTEEMTTEICRRIENGESLKKICEDPRMPSRAHIYGVLENKEKYREFFDNYTRASNARADNTFDEILEVAWNESLPVDRARLIVDSMKWYISKVMPKKYGDKLDITSDGKELPAPILGVIIPDKKLPPPNAPKQLT